MEKIINKRKTLLVKDDVLRTKAATRDLSHQGYTFGKANENGRRER